jgi:Arm DNA-binding domain
MPTAAGSTFQVSRWGSKSWLFRYMREGKARATGLGSLETVGLAEDREKARHLLAQGIDPIEQQKAPYRSSLSE